MQYLILSLIFLIPSLGMLTGLSIAATVAFFLLSIIITGFISFIQKQEFN
ncbi:hypothetical protein H374_7160 [Rickettsia prowazekii str. NMRC Madrid E]|nr:hypothetical protein H374_7160 [Rickettsia prowazekii str. NMRC Madrid E]